MFRNAKISSSITSFNFKINYKLFVVVFKNFEYNGKYYKLSFQQNYLVILIPIE